MGYLWSWGGFNNCFWSTHVFDQTSFFMFLSILIFDFDLILGSFLTFLGLIGLFLGLEKGSKTDLVSTHVVEQLPFSMFPSIMIFDFDLTWGHF